MKAKTRARRLFGDMDELTPRFSILHRDGAEQKETFSVDLLIMIGSPYDHPLTFSDLFATHPEFVKRGIGLNPDDFRDFYAEEKN